MCELLGMSANVPTDICFSFTGLILKTVVEHIPTNKNQHNLDKEN